MSQQEFSADVVAQLRKLADEIESGAAQPHGFNIEYGVAHAPGPDGQMRKIKSGEVTVTLDMVRRYNVPRSAVDHVTMAAVLPAQYASAAEADRLTKLYSQVGDQVRELLAEPAKVEPPDPMEAVRKMCK